MRIANIFPILFTAFKWHLETNYLFISSNGSKAITSKIVEIHAMRERESEGKRERARERLGHNNAKQNLRLKANSN